MSEEAHVEASVVPPEDMATSSTPEPGESPSKEEAAEAGTPSSAKNPPMSPRGEAPTTTRRAGASAVGAASRSAAAPGSRTPGATAKPATRTSPSTARRSVTSTSISSHQSHPSMSASEDEKRPGAKTTMASAARKTSSVRSSPSSTADKKPTPISTTSTARRPLSGTSSAASPRASSATTRPGTATTSSAAGKPTTARSGAAASSSTSASDARAKRLSAVGSATSTTRPSTRNSIRSEASLDAIKMVEELTSKIAEKDSEIEGLRAQICQHEQAVADLQEQADRAASTEAGSQESQREYEKALARLHTEHQKTIESFESRISEAVNKQQAAENDLVEALSVRDAAQAALETLKTSLAESEAKLKASEDAFQKALDDHATQMEELKAAVIDQKQHEQILADLTATHESAIADLKVQIDELTTSKSALETSRKDAIDSERAVHASAAAALESVVSDLKAKLEASETAVERSSTDGQTMISKLQGDLEAKESELASARENMVSTQTKIGELQSQLAEREGEMSKLKGVHDERLKQISLDYENEIETLRGDAIFRCKFEELEKQHEDLSQQHGDLEKQQDDLQKEKASLEQQRATLEQERDGLRASAAEFAGTHATAIATLSEQHSVTVNALETKLSDVEQTLQEAQANHAKEIQTLKSSVANAEEAYSRELESLKSLHQEALQSASIDGEATLAKQLEDIGNSHQQAILGLKDSQEQVIQELKGSHQRTVDELERAHQQTLNDLRGSHDQAFGGLQSQYCSEKEALMLSHESEIAAMKEASATSFAAERVDFQAQLDRAKTEMENVQSSHLAELDTARHELIESHVVEIEKMMGQHSETMETWEAERANAKKDLEELTAAHTKAIEDVVAEYRNNTSSYEEKISAQEAVSTKLQVTLEETQDRLESLQAESQDLSRQLAQEKMERMTLLAEFDAVKTLKPDTSALDTLKANLISTTKAYEETLASTRMSLQAKQEELDASKGSFKHLEERYTIVSQDLEFARKSLEAFKADAQVKQGIAEADYNDLNESMTLLVEEANGRVKGLESRVEDLAMRVDISQKSEEELLRRNEDLKRREEELLAQLKVRNAELAEEKAKAAVNLKGFANSRFIHNEFGEHAAAIVAEGEDDDDHSSAALALLSKVRLTTKQIDALDREMRDRNLVLLSSITDVNLSG